MKIRLLKDFLRIKKIAGVNVNTLRTLLEQNRSRSGPVVIDGKPLGCVNMRYQLKCKSNQCFLIQKEMSVSGVEHNQCHECHLRFLDLYEQDKIKTKK